MANVVTIGLASVEIGDVDAGGGMGTSLSALGYTEQDSCVFTIEEGETTDFIPEEVDDPIHSIQKPGEKRLEFTLMNAGADELVKILGGSVTTTGSSPNQVYTWNAPATVPNIEQSILVTPQEGMKLEITRAKITGSVDAPFSKNGLFTIRVIAKVLKPTTGSAFRFVQNQ